MDAGEMISWPVLGASAAIVLGMIPVLLRENGARDFWVSMAVIVCWPVALAIVIALWIRILL